MIYINDIPSLRDPESISYSFDDRIQKIQLIGGNTVQDYGHFEDGDVFTVSAVFSFSNYLLIKDLWINRTLVSFTDTTGDIYTDMRLVFKSVKRDANFHNYVTLEFELWRC